jgi:hypothetical protein
MIQSILAKAVKYAQKCRKMAEHFALDLCSGKCNKIQSFIRRMIDDKTFLQQYTVNQTRSWGQG